MRQQPIWFRQEELTPFQALLRDYMATQRLWTLGQLADRVGVSRQAVSNWFKGMRPSPEHIGLIHRGTGIGVRDLYRALGWAIPEPDETADPRLGHSYVPPTHWESMAWRIMNDPRIPEEAKADMLTMLDNARHGHDPMRKHIVAEHVVESDVPDQPTAELEAAHSHEESQKKSEHHERRAPQQNRRRSRPRAQPRTKHSSTV